MAEIERKRKERQAPVLKRPSAAKKDSSRNSYMDLFSTKKVEDTPAIEEPVAPAIVETAPVEVEEVIDEVFDEIIDIAPPTEVVEEVQEIQEIEEVAPVIEEIPAVNEEIAEEIIVPTEVIEEVIETPVEEPEEEFGDLDFSFDTKSKSVPKIVRDANKAAEKKADERPVDADDFFGTKKTKELSIGDGTIDKPEVSIEIADILDDELFDLSQRDSEEDENPSGKAILSAFDYDDGTEDRIAAQINMGAQSFIQLQEDVEDSLEYSKKRRGKKDAKPAYRIIQPTDADDFFRRPRQ